MPAPKGNKFWQARSTHGRDPKFKTADELLDACTQYFEWVEENPLYEMKPFAYQGDIKQEPVAKMRAMTIAGLCNYLGVVIQTWENYKAREDYVDVTTCVEQIIRQQKFEGAAADLLNANIIARDLGLADKKEHLGKDGEKLIPEMTESEVARRIAFLLAEAMENKT